MDKNEGVKSMVASDTIIDLACLLVAQSYRLSCMNAFLTCFGMRTVDSVNKFAERCLVPHFSLKWSCERKLAVLNQQLVCWCWYNVTNCS
jgi:hypothetical protein